MSSAFDTITRTSLALLEILKTIVGEDEHRTVRFFHTTPSEVNSRKQNTLEEALLSLVSANIREAAGASKSEH